MILSWVLTPILDLLGFFFSALPSGGTILDTTGGGAAGITGGIMGGYLHTAGYFLPVVLMTNLLFVAIGVFLPAVLVYQIAQWGYRELPTIGGFGPSS